MTSVFTALNQNRPTFYAFSLPEHADSLSIRRAYGNNGQGVAYWVRYGGTVESGFSGSNLAILCRWLIERKRSSSVCSRATICSCRKAPPTVCFLYRKRRFPVERKQSVSAGRIMSCTDSMGDSCLKRFGRVEFSLLYSKLRL